MKSCIYEGWIRHRRLAPVAHAFRYAVFMMYLDLGELDRVFRGRLLWSARRPALAWFRRRDHLGDPDLPLDVAARDLVEARSGRRPAGPVRLLSHLRYFGYCINPVSFYYFWTPDETEVEFVVAEIHNTPWGERHCYVVETRRRPGAPRRPVHRFDKAFHVSPFMGMDQEYRWRFADPGDRLPVHMQNHEGGRMIFDATMVLRRRPITGARLARVLVRHPLMTTKVVAAIYYQALRLRLKGAPFHPHPKHRAAVKEGAS